MTTLKLLEDAGVLLCSWREDRQRLEITGGCEDRMRQDLTIDEVRAWAEELEDLAQQLEEGMTKAAKLKLCRGCRNNFYNQSGNSTTGECWMLATAKPVKRTSVGYWQDPPYRWQPQTTLSCHQPEGLVWIKADDPRIKPEGGAA